VFIVSTDFKLLRQIKGNLINNSDFLNFKIPVIGDHCYCCQWRPLLLLASYAKNPATPLNIHCNSVNINTQKTLSMQQQLHFAPKQLLQLYCAKWLLYIPSAVTLMQSALSTSTVACLVAATQCNSRTLQTAVCVVWRLLCSTESYEMDCSLARILKRWGKGNT
jgi:hypothetical protein